MRAAEGKPAGSGSNRIESNRILKGARPSCRASDVGRRLNRPGWSRSPSSHSNFPSQRSLSLSPIWDEPRDWRLYSIAATLAPYPIPEGERARGNGLGRV